VPDSRSLSSALLPSVISGTPHSHWSSSSLRLTLTNWTKCPPALASIAHGRHTDVFFGVSSSEYPNSRVMSVSDLDIGAVLVVLALSIAWKGDGVTGRAGDLIVARRPSAADPHSGLFTCRPPSNTSLHCSVFPPSLRMVGPTPKGSNVDMVTRLLCSFGEDDIDIRPSLLVAFVSIFASAPGSMLAPEYPLIPLAALGRDMTDGCASIPLLCGRGGRAGGGGDDLPSFGAGEAASGRSCPRANVTSCGTRLSASDGVRTTCAPDPSPRPKDDVLELGVCDLRAVEPDLDGRWGATPVGVGGRGIVGGGGLGGAEALDLKGEKARGENAEAKNRFGDFGGRRSRKLSSRNMVVCLLFSVK